jgi:aminopeptidase-like protein
MPELMSVIPKTLPEAHLPRREDHARVADGIDVPMSPSGEEKQTEETHSVGAAMYKLVTELYPTCRSLTGDGVRSTLAQLQNIVPLAIHEVPSGTSAFDWNVPKEWNIRDAFIKDSTGRRVIDFRASNLHVVGYSVPVRAQMTLEELRPRLFTLPEHPDWIPYRTSYYREDW